MDTQWYIYNEIIQVFVKAKKKFSENGKNPAFFNHWNR